MSNRLVVLASACFLAAIQNFAHAQIVWGTATAQRNSCISDSMTVTVPYSIPVGDTIPVGFYTVGYDGTETLVNTQNLHTGAGSVSYTFTGLTLLHPFDGDKIYSGGSVSAQWRLKTLTYPPALAKFGKFKPFDDLLPNDALTITDFSSGWDFGDFGAGTVTGHSAGSTGMTLNSPNPSNWDCAGCYTKTTVLSSAASASSVFRMRGTMTSTGLDETRVPTFRLRVNSSDTVFSYSYHQDSVPTMGGTYVYSPGNAFDPPRQYDIFFSGQPLLDSQRSCNYDASFDYINSVVTDYRYGDVTTKRLEIAKLPVITWNTNYPVKTWNFTNDAEGWASHDYKSDNPDNPDWKAMASMQQSGDALCMAGGGFYSGGYWCTEDVLNGTAAQSGKLYKVVFYIESTVTDATLCPDFRFRVNSGGTNVMEVFSKVASATSPLLPRSGYEKTYEVIIYPLGTHGGGSAIPAAVDYIGFDPANTNTATLKINKVVVYESTTNIADLPAGQWPVLRR